MPTSRPLHLLCHDSLAAPRQLAAPPISTAHVRPLAWPHFFFPDRPSSPLTSPPRHLWEKTTAEIPALVPKAEILVLFPDRLCTDPMVERGLARSHGTE
jgi:hypothetical protein